MRKTTYVIAGLLALFTATSATAAPVREEGTVPECKPFGVSGHSCRWLLRYEPFQCTPRNPCSKLVIFFSGGNMSCMDRSTKRDRGIGAVLKRYSEDRYIAVCAQPYDEAGADAAGAEPYADTAPRIDALITSIRNSKTVKRLWNGKDLLIAGVSYGASAPVLAMTTTGFDDKPEWKGSRTTAACFHDGIYDIYALDKSLAADRSCNWLRNRAVCLRYKFGKNCPPVAQSATVDKDSAVLSDPSSLAIKTWKLIECGSKINRRQCAPFGDWLPKEPIEAMCKKIDGSSGHTCEFDAQPLGSHLSCALEDAGIDKCRLWFNRNAP